MSTNHETSAKEAEQIELAREVGSSLTDAFVAYVRGNVTFEDLSFGVYDALHDLMLVRSGEYELVEDDDDHDHDHGHHHHHQDQEGEVIAEQEDLAQEPVREGDK